MSKDEQDEPMENQAQDQAEIQGDGKTAGLLKEEMLVIKDANKVLLKIRPDLVHMLDCYLKEWVSRVEMDKIAKSYPHIENVEWMKVPRMGEELFHIVDMRVRTADQSLQVVQRVLMASMAALGAVFELGYRRGLADTELDELGQNVMDSLQLQAPAHNALLNKRKELLRPELSPLYVKEWSKGLTSSLNWLYGGYSEWAAKKCEVAKKNGDKIGQHKVVQQGKAQ